MSFKQALTDVSICNDALSNLAQGPIVSMNDTGLAARECRRHYYRVVGLLLEKHHWGLATQRANPVSTGDMPNGTLWAYQYRLPEDAAFVVRLAVPDSAIGGSYYSGLAALGEVAVQRFAVEGRVMSTNVSQPAIDYVSFNITEADFTEIFAEAVRLKLSAALAMPITKRADLRDKYEAEANSHLNQALARERNAQNPTYGDAPSASDYARAGLYEVPLLW